MCKLVRTSKDLGGRPPLASRCISYRGCSFTAVTRVQIPSGTNKLQAGNGKAIRPFYERKEYLPYENSLDTPAPRDQSGQHPWPTRRIDQHDSGEPVPLYRVKPTVILQDVSCLNSPENRQSRPMLFTRFPVPRLLI
jgi:hypothetical protein